MDSHPAREADTQGPAASLALAGRSAPLGSMLTWNRQRLSRFWDFEALRPEGETNYFSYHHGRALAQFLSRVTKLPGSNVLDFGCGPGFLVSELLAYGAKVTGCDYSTESVAASAERLTGRPGWLGGHLVQNGSCPLPDRSFDVVCCIEAIEHALDDDLPALFDEIRRLLRIGGLAVFTTPNSEHLSKSHVFCAGCSAVFHRWQHVRSWTPESLRQELEAQGYAVAFCDGLNIDAVPRARQVRLVEVSLQQIALKIRRVTDSVLDTVTQASFLTSREFQRCIASHSRPHLVAVARRQ